MVSDQFMVALKAKRDEAHRACETLLAEVAKRNNEWSEADESRWQELESAIAGYDKQIERGAKLSLSNGPMNGNTDRPDLRHNVPMSVPEFRQFGRQLDGISGEVYADERILRNLGQFFKAMYFRDSSQMPAEYRALNTAVGSAGGYLVPNSIASELVAYAFNKMAVLQAGARVVPMATQSVLVPKVAGVPAGAWYGEGDTIAEENVTVSGVSLEARRLSTLVKASIEVVQDSSFAVGEVVMSNVAKAFAIAIDAALLQGTGGKNTLTGLKNWPGVPTTSFGAALTNYDVLITSANAVYQANYAKDGDLAQIMFQGDLGTLATLKDLQNRYLSPPDFLANVPRYGTTNLTKTAGKTDLYSGDWNMLWLGVLMNQMQFTLDQRYAELGQIGWVFHWRGDSVATDPLAFDIRTTIG